jgi:hypothetical protein
MWSLHICCRHSVRRAGTFVNRDHGSTAVLDNLQTLRRCSDQLASVVGEHELRGWQLLGLQSWFSQYGKGYTLPYYGKLFHRSTPQIVAHQILFSMCVGGSLILS